MSLEGFYLNKQPDKLNWIYSRRALYNYKLARGLALQRLRQKFVGTEIDHIVEEIV